MNFGMILDEPATAYHATDCVSSHKLSDFARPNLPLLYQRKYVTKEAPPDAESDALEFGEYFHCLALEGEAESEARFAVRPSFDRRTTAGKAGAETFALANAGKKIIGQESKDLAWKMVRAIRAKPIAKEIFDHGRPEVVFRHKLASFAIQSRIDWFDERADEWKRPLIVDVKTIDHLANFDRHFHKYGYWRQAAFYQMVVYETLKLEGAFPRFRFVVVEKNEPFQVEVREPDEISMSVARDAVMADLARLKGCYDSGKWPGSADEVLPVSIPEWLQTKGAA